MDKIKIILNQVPENISEEKVHEILEKNDGDVIKTLHELWHDGMEYETDKNVIKNTQYDEKKQKWEEIRDICNSYEQEMNNFMQKNKS